MPEALVAALDELTVAWREAMADEAFRDRLRHHPARVRRCAEPALRRRTAHREDRWRPHPAQARGSQPHRRPQGAQRPRAGAADQADGQAPRDRRDRGRPARRGERDGGGLLRSRLHRLHGLGRRQAPGAQRRPHGAARRPGDPCRLRQRDAQGRHQRGTARLGRQRRPHGVPLRHSGRPAPVPEHGPRLHPRDRRRGAGPVPRPVRPAAGCGRRVRGRGLQRDRPVHCLPRRPGGRDLRVRGRRRRDRDRASRRDDRGRRQRRAARRPHVRAAGRGRPDHRVALHLGRPRLPGRRAAARPPRQVRPGRVPPDHRRAGHGRARAAGPHRGHHRRDRVGPCAGRRLRRGPPARPAGARPGQPLRSWRQGHGDHDLLVRPAHGRQ